MDCLSNNYKQGNPNFRAYHANEKMISKVLGASVGADAKKVRGQMEDLAKDVDIYLFPDKGENSYTDALVMYIKKPLAETKNKFLRGIQSFRRMMDITKTPYKSGFVFTSDAENLPNEIVESATRRKKMFLDQNK